MDTTRRQFFAAPAREPIAHSPRRFDEVCGVNRVQSSDFVVRIDFGERR
jgi:hypothetical protein